MTVNAISPSAWPSGGGDSLWTKLIPGIQQGLNLGFSIPEKMSDLKSKKLANQLSEINLQTQPQMNQADILYKTGMGNLTNEQAQYYPQKVQSEINQSNANTDLTKVKTQYAPLETLISATNSMRQNSRFNDAYNLMSYLKTLPEAERATFIAQHPDQMAQLSDTLGNKALMNQSSYGSDLLMNALKQYFPVDMQKLPQGQNQQNVLQNVNGGNNDLVVDPKVVESGGAANPQAATNMGIQKFYTTPEQKNQMTDVAKMVANKDLTTEKTRNQVEGAIQVQSIINDPNFQSKAMNASNYAGAVGRGKSAAAALLQNNPKAYEDYLSFKNQDMPILLNRIKQLDAMGATDSQREELKGLYSKTMDSLTSNPEQFMTQLNNLAKSLDTVAKGVQKSSNPVFDVNRMQDFKPIGSNKSQITKIPTPKELEYTAKTYNMTVDQVKKQLGIQ